MVFEFIYIVIPAIMGESRVNFSHAVQFSPEPWVQHSQLFFRVEPVFPVFHNRDRAAKPPGEIIHRFPGCQVILPGIENRRGAVPLGDPLKKAMVFVGSCIQCLLFYHTTSCLVNPAYFPLREKEDAIR